jgi:hypothetical protein
MKTFAVLVAALFLVAAVGPSFVHAQVAPAPSKDTANSSAKVAPQADQGTGANPSKTKAKKETASSQAPAPSKDTANSSAKSTKKAKKKTASQVAPAPSHDTANSSAKVAPQADQGTGTGMGQKKSTP